MFTGYEHPAGGYQAQWKLVVEALRECARRSAEYGVVIGVQNHHDIAADYQGLHDLIEAVDEPYCRAIFDAWAPALQGDDLAVAARLDGLHADLPELPSRSPRSAVPPRSPPFW